MASSANTVWQLRTTGSDNNGGGIVAGTAGQDYTQQDAAQWALTGVTSSGAGNTVLTASAAAGMVGYIAQAISGTNVTAGFYQVSSVSPGVSITFATNKAGGSICAGAAADGVINIGGALLTPGKVAAAAETGNMIKVDPGTYAVTATITDNRTAAASAQAQPNYWYGTSASNRPVFQANANSIYVMTLSGGRMRFDNIDFDANSGTARGCISIPSGAWYHFYNCRFHHATAAYACSTSAGGITYDQCDFYSNNATAGICLSNGLQFHNCRFLNNTAGSVNARLIDVNSGSLVFEECLFLNNTTGSNNPYFMILNDYSVLRNNTFYLNTYCQVRVMSYHVIIRDNLFVSGRSQYPLTAYTIFPDTPQWQGNFYYDNTTGNRSNMNSVAGIYAAYPTPTQLDVTTAAASPFVDASNSDFRLNAAATGGALARNISRSFPGGAISYKNFGALQSVAQIALSSILTGGQL